MGDKSKTSKAEGWGVAFCHDEVQLGIFSENRLVVGQTISLNSVVPKIYEGQFFSDDNVQLFLQQGIIFDG